MYEKKLQIPYYKHGNWKLDAERLDSIEQRVKVDENYKPNERLYTTFIMVLKIMLYKVFMVI